MIAFDRHADGTLTETQRIATGGKGSLNPVNGDLSPSSGLICPLSDSQGAVGVTPAGGLVFAVNAGSNTVSCSESAWPGSRSSTRFPWMACCPQSLTTHGNLLYVRNQNSGNITGFKFTTSGRLTEIPRSEQSLATPGPSGQAAQIDFDHTGSTLVVTERGTDMIDTFVVKDGVPGPAIGHPSGVPAVQPFGFAFDTLGHVVTSDVISLTDGSAGVLIARL